MSPIGRTVTGIGGGSPWRRATSAASASTRDESRPPEKLTTHGGRDKAATMPSANATLGSAFEAISRGEERPPGSGKPAAISSELNISVPRVGRGSGGEDGAFAERHA